jgi:hypothetical protein
MVDRRARDLLAEQLRHLTSGLSTNDDFEGVVLNADTEDRGYWAIVDEAWQLYSDLREHRLTETHALTRHQRRILCRFILFLHSKLEYEWTTHPCQGIFRLFAGLISFGSIPRYFDSRWEAQGEIEVYPFIRSIDFERSNAFPRLLTGSNRGNPDSSIYTS